MWRIHARRTTIAGKRKNGARCGGFSGGIARFARFGEPRGLTRFRGAVIISTGAAVHSMSWENQGSRTDYMHYVVCIKQVPDVSTVRIDPKRGTLIREGVPSVTNPFDLYALEAWPGPPRAASGP